MTLTRSSKTEENPSQQGQQNMSHIKISYIDGYCVVNEGCKWSLGHQQSATIKILQSKCILFS